MDVSVRELDVHIQSYLVLCVTDCTTKPLYSLGFKKVLRLMGNGLSKLSSQTRTNKFWTMDCVFTKGLLNHKTATLDQITQILKSLTLRQPILSLYVIGSQDFTFTRILISLLSSLKAYRKSELE